MRMIIMAAGCGKRMGNALRGQPKCLARICGSALIERQISAWQHVMPTHPMPVIVTGHAADHLASWRDRGCTLVHNPQYATTNMVHSLFCAESNFGEGFVMSYGDIAYAPHVLQRVLDDRSPISVAVDQQWRAYWGQRFDDVLADAESLSMDSAGRIQSIGQKVNDEREIEAQYIGLVAFRGAGVRLLREAYRVACDAGQRAEQVFENLKVRPVGTMFMTDMLQGLINLGADVVSVPIEGSWVEIDSPSDLELAERLVREGRLGSFGEVCERVG